MKKDGRFFYLTHCSCSDFMKGEDLMSAQRKIKSFEELRFSDDFMLRDVVVYEYNGETYIGRIVGMPGDIITTNVNGNVYQNGHLVYEEYVKYTSNRSMEVEIALNDNEYFVICDDRSQNFDSRQFGGIPEDNICGQVLIVLRLFEI